MKKIFIIFTLFFSFLSVVEAQTTITDNSKLKIVCYNSEKIPAGYCSSCPKGMYFTGLTILKNGQKIMYDFPYTISASNTIIKISKGLKETSFTANEAGYSDVQAFITKLKACNCCSAGSGIDTNFGNTNLTVTTGGDLDGDGNPITFHDYETFDLTQSVFVTPVIRFFDSDGTHLDIVTDNTNFVVGTGNFSNLVNGSATNNFGVGGNVFEQLTTGDANIAIGQYSLRNLTTGSNNIAIGDRVLLNNLSSNTIGIGYNALGSNTTGANNIGIGYLALSSNTTGSNSLAIGVGALTQSISYNNLGIGNDALSINSSGFNNTAVGLSSLTNNTTGSFNTAVGIFALNNNSTSSNNTGFGYQAAFNNTTGTRNIAIGNYALYTNTTFSDNLGIGYNALNIANGALYNVGVGNYTLESTVSGGGNMALGYGALRYTTGANNVGVGYQAGDTNTSGNENTFIGHSSGTTDGTVTNSTAIGAYAQISLSNTIILGTSSQRVGIGTSSPNSKAVLDLTSTSKGFLPPRMTTAQVTSTGHSGGLMMYDTDLGQLKISDGFVSYTLLKAVTYNYSADLASLAAGATITYTLSSATGISAGTNITVFPSVYNDSGNVMLISCKSNNNNEISLILNNISASAIDMPTLSFKFINYR